MKVAFISSDVNYDFAGGVSNAHYTFEEVSAIGVVRNYSAKFKDPLWLQNKLAVFISRDLDENPIP